MKNMINIGSRLAIICAVSAIILAVVNSKTAPIIVLQQENAVKEALEQVSSGYTVGEQQTTDDPEINYIYPLYKDDSVVGYIMNLQSNGYGGPMKLLASFTTSGETLGVKLVEDSETPGLGKKAESNEYMTKFIGKGDSTPLPLKKSDLTMSEADSVSGASITFGGIAKALSAGSLYAKKLGGAK